MNPLLCYMYRVILFEDNRCVCQASLVLQCAIRLCQVCSNVQDDILPWHTVIDILGFKYISFSSRSVVT